MAEETSIYSLKDRNCAEWFKLTYLSSASLQFVSRMRVVMQRFHRLMSRDRAILSDTTTRITVVFRWANNIHRIARIRRTGWTKSIWRSRDQATSSTRGSGLYSGPGFGRCRRLY